MYYQHYLRFNLDERKTLTKISTRKHLTTVPQTAHALDNKETGRKPSIKRQTTGYTEKSHLHTEWRGSGKAKEQTLGDAYPHINFQDVAWLERLAWAIYDGVFVPDRAPDMSGYQDWDHIVVGTLVPLIYQEEMVWDHCGPTTIAGANTQRATELMKEHGLLCYKERRVHIVSSEECVASLEVPT